MKALTKRKPAAGKAGRCGNGDGGPAAVQGASIKDGSGTWSAGLCNDAQATLLGRIAGLMPHVDELVADLTARFLDDAESSGRTLFDGVAGDEQRVNVLRALRAAAPRAGKGDDPDAAIAAYAAARRRWRAYLDGRWYTHENGRTFLAPAAGADAATFLVAREVRIAELESELARLAELGTILPRLARQGGAATVPPRKPRTAPVEERRPETAKAGRAAPKRQPRPRRSVAGTRQSDFAV